MSKESDKKALPEDGENLMAEREAQDEADEFKVIDRGGSKLVIKGGGISNQDEGTGREILVEPRVVETSRSENLEVLEEEELVEVVQLKDVKDPGKNRLRPEQAEFVQLEKPPDKTEEEEGKWEHSKGVGLSWGMLFAGMMVVVLLVGILTFKYFYELDESEQQITKVAPPVGDEDLFKSASKQWFHKNRIVNRNRAIALLEKYVSAKNNEERSLLVRDPESYLEHIDKWPVEFRPRAVDDDFCVWAIRDIEEDVYLKLMGRDVDFMPMRAYFVRDGDNDALKLDWHASVGWSKVSMREMKNRLLRGASLAEGISDKDSIVLRCFLTKKQEFYVTPYDENEHSSYMLISADRETYFWAYTKRASQLDESLRQLLDHGRFVVDLKKNFPVTVRVKKPSSGSALPIQLDLVDLVHSEWLTPLK